MWEVSITETTDYGVWLQCDNGTEQFLTHKEHERFLESRSDINPSS